MIDPPGAIDAAYIDGVAAFLDGIPPWWTPHRMPSPEGIAWCNGWHDAQRTRLVRLSAQRAALKRRRAAARAGRRQTLP